MTSLEELQKALNKLEEEYPHISLFRIKRVKDEFSAFQKDYDDQLHVPRFSVCMSNEDYDRLVHIPRKQLEETLEKEKGEITRLHADDEDFLGFEDNRDHIFYAGQSVGKHDLLKGLLEAKKGTEEPSPAHRLLRTCCGKQYDKNEASK